MPAPREGDDTVPIEQQRVTRSSETEKVDLAEQGDCEGKMGLQAAKSGNGGEQDDGKSEKAHRPVSAPEPADRDQHAERDERQRDRVLQVANEVAHPITSA